MRLLEGIISKFQDEISFKIFYSAIDDKLFFAQKKNNSPHTDTISHPYIAACYKVISSIETYQQGKKNNKGKTFLILDEQNKLQHNIEQLISSPIHQQEFTQIIDTAYFGKSHYSKLIQIADLIAGIIRYHLCSSYLERRKTHFTGRIETIFGRINQNSITRECFRGNLSALYNNIEIKNP